MSALTLADAKKYADTFMVDMEVTGIFDFTEVGTGPTWMVLAPVQAKINPDLSYIVVEDDGTCHATKPWGRWFQNLTPPSGTLPAEERS